MGVYARNGAGNPAPAQGAGVHAGEPELVQQAGRNRLGLRIIAGGRQRAPLPQRDGLAAAGRLQRVLPGYDGPARPMHLIFAADCRPTPKLRRFTDAVVAEFGQNSPAA